MNTAPNSDDEIRCLFQKHVPEVASGMVELVSIAREKGDRVLVAVRSHDPSIDPVSVCVGKGGIHIKNFVRELGGEKVSIVLWSPSIEGFVLAALGSFGPLAVRTPKVTLDIEARLARVDVSPDTFSYLVEQGSSQIRVASRLVGWKIRIVSDGKR